MKSLKHSGFYMVLITLIVNSSGISASLAGSDIESAPKARASAAGVDSLVTAEWLHEHLQEPDLVILVDTMPAEHYRGEMVMYGKAGHILTAINISTVFSEEGHFLAEQALHDLHPFDQDARIIIYCGGGITSCQSIAQPSESG